MLVASAATAAASGCSTSRGAEERTTASRGGAAAVRWAKEQLLPVLNHTFAMELQSG